MRKSVKISLAAVGLVVVLVAAVAAGLLLWRSAFLSGPECTVPGDPGNPIAIPSVELTAVQLQHASTINAVGLSRGISQQGRIVAVATAYQESSLRNRPDGDRDSVGLFQQRPSQGWGTAEQILDPEYSTNKFYDALAKVKGYQSMDIAQAAQKVQRSAAGDAYAQHEAQARVTASALAGQTHGGMVCALEDPGTPGDPGEVAALVEKDFGVSADEGKGSVTVRADSDDLAWAIGSWAVARADDTGATRVVVGDREWRRGMQDSALKWHTVDPAPGTDDTTVSIHVT